MGRRNVTGTVVALAAAALVAQAAAGAVPFRVLAKGNTAQHGQSPHAYLAVSATGHWLTRLSAADRARVRRVDFARREVVAVFLDGFVCGSDPAVRSLTRVQRVLRVVVVYTKPPPGVAMCVRLDTPYIVITVPRTKPLPINIQAEVLARS